MATASAPQVPAPGVVPLASGDTANAGHGSDGYGSDVPAGVIGAGRWIERWTPEDETFWQARGKAIALRNLVFSIVAEHIGFFIWLLWSIVVVKMYGTFDETGGEGECGPGCNRQDAYGGECGLECNRCTGAHFAGVETGNSCTGAHSAGAFWPCPSTRHPGTPRVFLERFATADGRARMVAVDHRAPLDDVRADAPVYLVTGRVLTQYQSGAQTRRVPEFLAPEPEP